MGPALARENSTLDSKTFKNEKKNTLQIFIDEKRILLVKFPQILPQM